MKYGLIYRLQHLMMNDVTEVTVNIYDTDIMIDDLADPQVIPLKGSGNPLTVSTVNNDRKKYGIFSKQAKIEFLSSNAVNAHTFADSKDFQFYVECLADANYIFKGWLVVDEAERPFLPNPNVITLIASDNLGLLKEKPLVNDSGDVPSGKFRIADFISWCLKLTNLELPVNVVNNVRAGKGSLANPALFSSAGNYFVTSGLLTTFFYEGQRVVVTGTTSNNTTYTVDSVDNTGLVTQVNVIETISTGETSSTAVFTDAASGHIYDNVYIDSLTFEKEIGECEDAYTVLEKILDKDCLLTQYKGEWWIVRYDEITEDNYFVAIYDADGVLDTPATSANYEKSIGAGNDNKFIEASQSVGYERPIKFAKHTFRIESPNELPCNNNYERGEFVEDLPNEEIEGETFTAKKYELTCFDLVKDYEPPTHPDPADENEAYVKKLTNEYGDNKETFAVVTWPSTHPTRLETQAIDVEKNDKISISYDRRYNGNITESANYLQCHLRLEAQDGTVWFWEDNDSQWHQTDDEWSDTRTISEYLDTATYEIDWYNVSIATTKIPDNGKLILAIYWGNSPGIIGADLHLKNIRFTYNPYIAGSYQRITGQSSKVQRLETGYSANVDEEVSLSDSPKPILKGGMFTLTYGGNFMLNNIFWSSAQFALDNPPATDYYKPFEYHRVNAMYNQNHKCIRYVTGNLLGLTDEWPDLIHNYTLTDADLDVNNRRFMLINLEQDWKTGKWSGTFAEVYHTDGKVFPSFEFKYITE